MLGKLPCIVYYKFFDLHLGDIYIYYAESGGENYLANACPRKFKGLMCF